MTASVSVQGGDCGNKEDDGNNGGSGMAPVLLPTSALDEFGLRREAKGILVTSCVGFRAQAVWLWESSHCV